MGKTSKAKKSKKQQPTPIAAADYNCHQGIIRATGDEYVELYGAGTSREPYAKGYPDNILLIIHPDSVNPLLPPEIEAVGPLADILPIPDYPEPTILSLPWPDFHAPAVPPQFWAELAAAILRIADQSDILPVGVLCHCVGGHGRTGTMLSTLAYHLGLVDAEDVPTLVSTIRSRYCPNAVESTSQWQHIATSTGLPAGQYDPPAKVKALEAAKTTHAAAPVQRQLPSGIVEYFPEE